MTNENQFSPGHESSVKSGAEWLNKDHLALLL